MGYTTTCVQQSEILPINLVEKIISSSGNRGPVNQPASHRECGITKRVEWLPCISSLSNSGTVSVVAAFKKSSTEATSCRALVLLDTVSKLCGLPWEAFYDTLYQYGYYSYLIISPSTVCSSTDQWGLKLYDTLFYRAISRR
jgi:hypothetical protein